MARLTSFACFTWVDGVPMATVQPHSADLLRSLGAALARVDRALTGFEHAAAHRVFYWDLRHASMAWRHLDLLPEARRRLLQPVYRRLASARLGPPARQRDL
jgi:Ser/Thr protein kinase RdoA (MazF antagonist)